jgi:hypothetical protein
MNRSLRIVLGLVAALGPAAALPCGGFYAQNVEVSPAQKIILTHRGGVETYTFRPHFCGVAKDFGVILPIPATLASNPELANDALFGELDTFTIPEPVEVCEPTGPAIGCGSKAGAMGANGDGTDGGQGVNVVDKGKVGIFDYVLVQATTTADFTSWLDQNGFPHDPSGTPAFDYYVTKGWYFVAFKVTADTALPPAGKKLCGDLGPISLSFATAQPVIPARIAAVNAGNGTPTWRIFTIAGKQQKISDPTSVFSSSRYFSKTLKQSELGSFSALAAASQDGERLTALDVSFGLAAVNSDLDLADDPAQADFRTKQNVYKTCTGCATGRSLPGGPVAAMLFFGLLAMRPARRAARVRK